MKALAFKRLLRLAAALVIFNQETATTAPWTLNEEQVEVLEALCTHKRVLVLKGRQVGVSTVCCLYDLAFAIANAGVGVVICADTQDNANALLQKIRDFCKQLGIPLAVDNVESIKLENGSYIDAKSAVARLDGETSESRTGRSRTYLLLHMTEVGFWGNDEAVFRALTSGATSPHVRMIVESTASAADNLFKLMWETPKEKNGWHHVWLSIEKHRVYRSSATDIDDATWEKLKGYGFTVRESGAWWWGRVQTEFNGDLRGARREYPVKPEDCFAFAEGRWILGWAEETAARYVGEWDEKTGVFRGWVYYPNVDKSEEHVAGVDVGAGLGLDSHAIAIKGRRSRTLKAIFVHNLISIPAFEKVIATTSEKWNCKAVRIEKTGVGEGLVDHLQEETDVPVVEQKSNSAEKHTRMTRLKIDIESGKMPIGKEVIGEAMSSRISKPVGPRGSPVYTGRDDILNALTFAEKQLEEEGKQPPAPETMPSIRDVFIPQRKTRKPNLVGI